MSDILIRGMELEPGRISELIITPDGSVYKNKWDFCVGLKPIGQAVELPPHGDLIDRSELLEKSKVHGMYPHWIDTMDVKRAPVVVPAERREGDG